MGSVVRQNSISATTMGLFINKAPLGVFLAFAIVVNFCNAKIYKCPGNHEETVVFNGLDTLTWKSIGTNKDCYLDINTQFDGGKLYIDLLNLPKATTEDCDEGYVRILFFDSYGHNTGPRFESKKLCTYDGERVSQTGERWNKYSFVDLDPREGVDEEPISRIRVQLYTNEHTKEKIKFNIRLSRKVGINGME